MPMLLVILLLLAVPTIGALSNSNIPKSSLQQPSDRILSPDYYKSVYKNIDGTRKEQQQTIATTGSDGDGDDDDDADDVFDTPPKIGGRTPWDLGNNRPQPAIVRAYKEGKIRGNVLDAGCGIGENCIFLANKYGIQSVTGFDLSEDAIQIATRSVDKNNNDTTIVVEEQSPFWTTPKFLAASCTDVADCHRENLLSGIVGNNDDDDDDKSKSLFFDVVIDSGLLHCLSKEDAGAYVDQISKLLLPKEGRFYIGCFSTENPDPWDNPRRISEEYLRNELFSNRGKWEVVSCRDCWWARPPTRGSSTGGAFSLALWVEVRCLVSGNETNDD